MKWERDKDGCVPLRLGGKSASRRDSSIHLWFFLLPTYYLMYSLRACALLALAGGALVDAAPAAGYCLVQPRPVTESAVASSAITSEYVVSSSVTPVASSSITPSSVTSSSISSSSVISSSVTPSPVTSSSATPTPTPFKECDPADAVNAVLIGLEADASPLCLAYLGGDKTVEETQVRFDTYAEPKHNH